MKSIKLGRTNLEVFKDGLGALPLQRTNQKGAVRLIQRALAEGINYIDTARAYSDSEEKLGCAIKGKRSEIVIATKTASLKTEDIIRDLEISLKNLQTDYIDVYQLHNPDFVPKKDSEVYGVLEKIKKDGKIRFIGITNHRLHLAKEAVESKLYDVLQYPLSYLSTKAEEEIVELCSKNNIGFVAMKALAGGLITDISLAIKFHNLFANCIPIWGIQHLWELESLIKARGIVIENVPNKQDNETIETERKILGENFCRGCGYCLPCPSEIKIFNAARTSLLIRRAPQKYWFSEEWQEEMKKIKNCKKCGLCKSKCPYGLDTPTLLQKNLNDYLNELNSFISNVEESKS